MALQENLREARAKDTVGTPKARAVTMGGQGRGTAVAKGNGGSSAGVGGGLKGDNTATQPIFYEAAYRTDGKDNNYVKNPETGTPRQEASYQNRDRQGSGLESEPSYQRKVPSYPAASPKTKRSSTQDV